MAAADLDGNGTIEVVVTTTNTSTTWLAGVRVQRLRERVSPERGSVDRVAPVQRDRPALQRGRQPRLRGVRRERRDRKPRRRPAARDRRHVRQPPDQRLQPRRLVGPGIQVVHEPRERTRGGAARLGTVHPLAEPARRGSPLPPPRRPMARRPPDALASVDGVAAERGRPRRGRARRGDRPAERGARHSIQDRRLRVHGARRRPARRGTVGSPAPRLRNTSPEPQAGLPSRRRLVPPIGHPGADRRRPRARPPPRNRGRRARRLRLRGRTDGPPPLALRLRPRTGEDVRLRGGGRRPQPRRSPRARLRHLRPAPRRGAAGGAVCRRPADLRQTPPPPGHRRQRHRRSRGAVDRRPERGRSARDRGVDVRSRDRRLPGSGVRDQQAAVADGSAANKLPWPTGRGSLLRAGAGPATAP